MRQRIPLLLQALAVIATAGVGMAGWLWAAPAPQVSGTEGGTKRYYYEPPNNHQVRTELSSAEETLIPDSGGKVSLKGFKIKQFQVTGGKPQMTAEAPECVFDYKRQEVASAGPLQVHAQDDRLFLEGTGFILRQTNSSLTISNGVHSMFRQQPATNGAPSPGTEVSARGCNLLMKTETTDGSITYRKNVQLNDPKMKLTCEFLFAELPRESSGQTNRHAVAETNVVIDFTGENGEQTRATGRKAVYNYSIMDGVTNEIVDLTGEPRVELTNGWMTADRFIMDRATGKLHGRGHVHFHYLAPDNAVKSNAPGQSDTDIFCDGFDHDLNTRQAVFTGQVRANEEKMKLAAEFVTATLPKSEPGKTTPHLEHVVAETNVVIDLQGSQPSQKIRATSQNATYDYRVNAGTTNEIVTLTGNPAVQTANSESWITADTISVDRAQGRIWGTGNQHSVFKRRPGQPTALDTEVFSAQFEYALATGLAVYRDNVREYDPELNSTGKTLTIKIVQDEKTRTNHIESARMDGNAAIDYLDKPFSGGDITNLTALASRLQQPAASDGVAKFVASELSATNRWLLASYQGGTNATLAGALADDLNKIVHSGAIYDAARFASVYLSLDTTAKMNTQPLGVDLMELNRLLLLDAFRGQISRNPNGEKIHATGDHAIFSHNPVGSTNSMVELLGNARLDKSEDWTTAEDSIIADRTTGKVRALGHPHLHMRLEKVPKNKLSGGPNKATK